MTFPVRDVQSIRLMTEFDRALNSAAYIRVRADLPNRYPHLQFAAFGEGAIIADDADFEQLDAKLEARGRPW